MYALFTKTLLVAAFITMAGPVRAQETEAELSVSGHGKTAYMANERQRRGWYDGVFHFSPAVRGGDYIYLSGVVAGAFGVDGSVDREGFKSSVRKAFETMQDIVKAAGADINQTIKIQTFHVFDSPLITIGKAEQVKVVAEVKGEFIAEPHPAWTAVGTTALLPDKGLVEIEIVLYAPLAD